MLNLRATVNYLIFTLNMEKIMEVLRKKKYSITVILYKNCLGVRKMNLYDCKILLVDDNTELAEMTRGILQKNGYEKVVTAATCESAMRVFEQEEPDLIILDIMLPDGDGFTLFRQMRECSMVPILFLSAKDQDNDRLFGLGLGADDYITKPFLSEELVLRVGAILKRTYFMRERTIGEAVIELSGRKVSFENATVEYQGESIALTAKELIILKKLATNRGNIVTFDALAQAVWNDNYYGYENSLMVHIRHLREKIEEDPSHPKWILTARGLGYRLAKEG